MAAILAVLTLVAGGFAVPAAAAEKAVTFNARLDGRPVGQATERRPLALQPRRPLTLELSVTNRGDRPVQVRTIRLSGTVIGLTFFAYETTVGINVPAGATVDRRFSLDLGGLSGQATGLLPGSIILLDPGRHSLAGRSLVVDVRGSLASVYGIFGIVLAIATALSLGGALLALSRNRLPYNRWRRGLRFLPGGIGLGLSVVFTLSALRVFVARPGRWVPIVLVAAGLVFAVGYFTPAQEELEESAPPPPRREALMAGTTRLGRR